MKKTFILLLACALFLSYGCSTVTLKDVKQQTEEKSTILGRILHLPVTAYRGVVKGFKSEEEADNDTLID